MTDAAIATFDAIVSVQQVLDSAGRAPYGT
jgi:hypothetical protein